MGSCLSPVIANIFLNHFESNHIQNCPESIKPILYKRYLDDTFLLFDNENLAIQFFNYFNQKHKNISFTFEAEKENKISFLDVTVERCDNSFSTNVFRKNTFSGQGTNFFSNIFYKYKISSIYTLINRAFVISSSYKNFHSEIEYLQSYFISNNYPSKIVSKMVRKFLDKLYNISVPTTTVEKHKIYLELPMLGHQNKRMLTEVQNLICKFYPQTNPMFYFCNNFKIGSFFRRFNSSEMLVRSSVIYEYHCDSCQLSYIGSTSLQMYRRCAQHKGVSFRTGNILNKQDKSSIREHSFNYDHPIKTANFKIIDQCNNISYLRLLESVYIKNKMPALNNNQVATPLNVLNS